MDYNEIDGNIEEENYAGEMPNDDMSANEKEQGGTHHHDTGEDNTHKLTGMYKNWFLDYASYVILERAVPHMYDGLKPVQRRILHAMRELDDGRYNKVANVVGHTMQYHHTVTLQLPVLWCRWDKKSILLTARETGVTYSPATRRQRHVT
jgi:hypothetical protein